MMRIVALLIFGSVLAACSGSSRIEDIFPSRAGGLSKDTPPRSGTARYEAQEKRLEGRSRPDTESRQAEKPVVRSFQEE
jgi:hypothetical protein